ncbi:hypothetical protein MPSEU_000405200 [Mayamaea pseudoterrestris]|nr:hypothetical protein MPSEU_000405200 [Mayamaea pseudoterrestris]
MTASSDLLATTMDNENTENVAETTAYSSFLGGRRRGAFGRSKHENDDEGPHDGNDKTAAPSIIAASAMEDESSTMLPVGETQTPRTDLFDLDDESNDGENEFESDLDEPSQELSTVAPRRQTDDHDVMMDTEALSQDDNADDEEAFAAEQQSNNHHHNAADTNTSDNDDDDDDAPPTEPKELSLESIIQSTDELFAGIEDKFAVTVKDVLLALQDEYQLKQALSKDMRSAVRSRLVELIQLEQQQEAESDADDESAVGTADDSEDDDIDDELMSKQKTSRTKSGPSRPNARALRKTKASAMRIHAAQLRKRRMEELKVRNEELQAAENVQDQERSDRIAAKFETNTDELRLQRLEQKLGLLQKLDRKRVNIIVQQQKLVVKDKVQPAEQVAGNAPIEEEESSEDDDDMELELVGARTTSTLRQYHKSSALSLLDMMAKPHSAVAKQYMERHHSSKPKKPVSHRSPGKSMNARAALKNKLRSKSTKMGNAWLARELGYKTEEEHLKDCLVVEERKRVRALKLEEERIKLNEFRRERMLADGYDEEEDEKEHENSGGIVADSDAAKGDDQFDADDEEEDEEMAMAREIEQEEATQESGNESMEPVIDDSSSVAEGNAIFPAPKVEPQPGVVPLAENPTIDQKSLEDSNDANMNAPAAQDAALSLEPTSPSLSRFVSESSAAPHDAIIPANNEQDDWNDSNMETTEDVKAIEGEPEKPKGPRNSGWQAVLRKEAEQMKKLKRRKGAGLVEDEADEEEEEEVAGLEDFGFTVKKKKDDDDDERVDDEINEDDLEHVVDDLSDNEGDEDAGEQARKLQEKKEEKERHKEMMRRMRDGYDGRRGGIAVGGAGARGMHRFDQLVAADNREDAKRLGLLNDDELDSDDEEGDEKNAPDDEEDEVALLDKMLKDRFLHRSSELDLEENFSDDEDNAAEDDIAAGGTGNQDEEEEKEQERLAKRFAKRARMQRLMELHGQDEEFSQNRLLEEDTMLKDELSQMKTGLARKRNQTTSIHSTTVSLMNTKKQKTAGLFGQSVLAKSSLATALQASRPGSKSRTSFLRAGSTVSGGNDATASFQKSIAFKNVIFHSNDSRSNMSSSLGVGKTFAAASKTSNRPTKSNPGTSLWAKAVSGFQRT